MKARTSAPEFLSFIPLAGFLWLLFYAYVAYLQAGHWPSMYGRPDPTSIGPWITGYALMGVLMAFMFASPLALIAIVWFSSKRGWLALFRPVSIFTLGAILFSSELLHLQEWLLD